MTDETTAYPTDLGMICSCGDRAPAAEALVDEVTRRLRTDIAHFLTKVSWSLRQKHRVARWDVVADQWFLLRASTYGGDSVVVACDELEQGLAALWLHYTDGRTPGLDD